MMSKQDWYEIITYYFTKPRFVWTSIVRTADKGGPASSQPPFPHSSMAILPTYFIADQLEKPYFANGCCSVSARKHTVFNGHFRVLQRPAQYARRSISRATTTSSAGSRGHTGYAPPSCPTSRFPHASH